MEPKEIEDYIRENNIRLGISLGVRGNFKPFSTLEALNNYMKGQRDNWKQVASEKPYLGLLYSKVNELTAKIELVRSKTTDVTPGELKNLSDLIRSSIIVEYGSPLGQYIGSDRWSSDDQQMLQRAITYLFEYGSNPFHENVLVFRHFIVMMIIALNRKDHEMVLANIVDSYVKNIDDLRGKIGKVENELSAEIAQYRNDKTQFIDVWNKRLEDLRLEHQGELTDIEKTFKEFMRLAVPVEVWKGKQDDYTKRAWVWTGATMATVAVILGSIFVVFRFFPPVIVIDNVADYSSAARWAVMSGLGIGSLIFLLRHFLKLTLSSFHMARDAEERSVLTRFYLSLIKEKALEPDKESELKAVVMNALFARVDTGLLKGDGPTMPTGGIAEIARLFQGK